MSSAPEFSESHTIDQQPVTIRSMHSEDREIEDQFVRALSPESRYYRFHGALQALSPSMLDHFTKPNYPDEMALIATIDGSGREKQIGVVRYARTDISDHAEVAIVVADEWQGKGLGTRLMKALRGLALDAGIRCLEVNILKENKRMLGLAKELGYLDTADDQEFSAVVLGKGIKPDQ